MDYYKINLDSAVEMWELAEPVTALGTPVDESLFLRAQKYMGSQPLVLRIEECGQPVSFYLSAFHMPVVERRFAERLDELCSGEAQLVAVTVPTAEREYVILNVLQERQCVDEQKTTEVGRWTMEDGIPELVGKYHALTGLRVDARNIGDAQIFRIKDFPVALIVSERVKDAWEEMGISGVKFQPVS